jgi:ferredoxin-nitrite reductase
MLPGNNAIEAVKATKDGDGLRIREDLPRFVRDGWESLSRADKDLLKWVGVFFRNPTPGYFMMRIRMPNGFAASEQLRSIAELSKRLGNSILDITTRQQVELRGFTIQSVPEIWEKLRGVNLHSIQTGMDNVRNINGCALAGLTPNELLDASPVLFELDRIIVGENGNPEFTNLPRKFNITVTGCLENCTHNESQDIALAPATKGDRIGFNVLVGGKMGSGGFTVAGSLGVFVELREAARVAAEIVRMFRDHGPRDARAKVRLSFLLEQWGFTRFRAQLEYRLKRDLEPAGDDARRPHHSDHLGVTCQKQQGVVAVGLYVPTGRIDPNQMAELAYLADTYGNGQIRFTTGQNAIVPNVPVERLQAMLQEPLLRELSPRPASFTRGLVACTGTDYCNLAQIETKSRATELAQELEKRLGRDAGRLTMHWSGCPAGCGNHQAADIGFRGLKLNVDGELIDAVAIYAGGRTGPNATPGEEIIEAVPCDEKLVDVVAGILEERFGITPKTDRATTPDVPLSAVAAALPTKPNGRAGKSRGAAAAVAELARVRACTLSELSEGKGRVLQVDGKSLALFFLEGQVVATDAHCPHAGGPLHEGAIEAGCVMCPWHGFGFDLATGRCDSDPNLALKTYTTTVERNDVWVEF